MARNRSASPASDHNAGHSGSPPQNPPSKRDKRRIMLSEKLEGMVNSFKTNLRPHFDAQVTAVQLDMRRIMLANPYAGQPLDDSGEDTMELVNNMVRGQTPTDSAANTDFIADTGKFYSEFTRSVNNAMAERDTNLTLLHVSGIHSEVCNL